MSPITFKNCGLKYFTKWIIQIIRICIPNHEHKGILKGTFHFSASYFYLIMKKKN